MINTPTQGSELACTATKKHSIEQENKVHVFDSTLT